MPDTPGSRRWRQARTTELFALLEAESGPERRLALQQDIVVLNQRVAFAIALRYRNRGLDDQDLRQVALEGLVKAVSRFDPSRTDCLLTYAVPIIRGEVQRYFRDLGWTVRPPRRIQEMQWRMSYAVDELSGELGREPDRHEVAERLGVAVSQVDEAGRARGCFTPASLDLTLDTSRPGGMTLGEILPSQTDELGAPEARVVLEPALARLPTRARRILHLRFVEDLTQQEIADQLHITQTQISRILSQTLATLRDDLGVRTAS